MVAQVEISILGKPTVRHTKCEVLIPPPADTVRCSYCQQHRTILTSIAQRQSKATQSQISQKSNPSSHTNYRYLTPPEMVDRISRLHKSVVSLKLEVNKLQKSIALASDKAALVVDEALHNDLKCIMKANVQTIKESFPPNSFQRIFWDQQIQAASVSSPCAMKWHPLMVKWCIYLRHKSSGSYEQLRQSGCVHLPSQRTLRDYTHYVPAVVGFSAATDLQLAEAFAVDTCEEYKKYVCLSMDEMFIKSELVYDKHSRKLLGFVNLGEVNNHLIRFEQQTRQGMNDQPQLACHMLVFYVRSFFTRLQYPYSQFPCSSLAGEQIYKPFWLTVSRLERIGLKVVALTCDGLSANRAFFRLHGPTINKVQNHYAPESETRYIYFFSDPPHLIKTVRNCWFSSKRHLWVGFN